MSLPNTYSAFGLTIRSEVPLPDLGQTSEQSNPDVEIRRSSLPLGRAEQPGYNLLNGASVLNIPMVGRYLISDGKEIIVDAAPNASERNVRLYLLGSALGAILHQRGLLPLHANAVQIEGRVFAFAGHSGAGKSTLAAWFYDRGHTILADDVCAIAFTPGGPMAYPGIPRLRLWREALELSGRSAEDYDRSFSDMDKYDVPTQATEPLQPLPIERIYLLKRADDETGGAKILRLAGVEAVDAIVSNTYRGGYLQMSGRTGEHLESALKLVRSVPVFAAYRDWGLANFGRQAKLLEEHVRSYSE